MSFNVGDQYLLREDGWKKTLTILSTEAAKLRLGDRLVDTIGVDYLFCFDSLTGLTRAFSKQMLKKHGKLIGQVPVTFQPTDLLGGNGDAN
jgi:hypothetical protein